MYPSREFTYDEKEIIRATINECPGTRMAYVLTTACQGHKLSNNLDLKFLDDKRWRSGPQWFAYEACVLVIKVYKVDNDEHHSDKIYQKYTLRGEINF